MKLAAGQVEPTKSPKRRLATVNTQKYKLILDGTSFK